jgi:Tol biopolymer transport system component
MRQRLQLLCALAWAFAIACATYESVAPTSVRDAGTDTGLKDPIDAAVALDSSADADSSVPRCDPSKAFEAPQVLADLPWMPGVYLANPSLTADERTLYFASSAGSVNGYPDIFVSSRANRDVPFGPVARVDALSSAGSEYHVSVSGDGTLLFIARDEGMGPHILFATKGASGIGNVGRLMFPDAGGTGSNEGSPSVRPDGTALYFAINGTSESIDFDIYKVSLPYSGQAPARLAELSSSNADTHPVLDANEKRIYFASNRQNAMNVDVWTASRSNTADAFSAPTLEPNLSAPMTNDYPDWLSPDGCVMYLTRTVPAVGGARIYTARKP